MRRLTIQIDDHVADKLQELAGGPRRQSDFVANLIQAAYDNQQVKDNLSLEGIRYQMTGMMAEIQTLKSQVSRLQIQTME